jgi:VWFA-related protein
MAGHRRVAILLSLAALAVVSASAQQTQQPPPTPAAQTPQTTFRGGTLTVPIYATVHDGTGRLVPDLGREHFEIFDEGVRQEITVFRSDVQPISVVVMLDTSGSMTLTMGLLVQAAEQFVIRLMPEDRARIGSFSDKILLSQRFTGDRDELIRFLHEDIQYGNPTFLWDAIAKSMDALADEKSRKVVLIFTDGEDEKSQAWKFKDLLARASAEDIMIYAIGLRNVLNGRVFKPDNDLPRLAAQTGGGYFELTRASELSSTFTRVADELHRQYVLGFTPASADGRLHLLDVRVKVDGMTARARRSYVATKAP